MTGLVINIKRKGRALKMPEIWICVKTIEVLVWRASGNVRRKYDEKLQREGYQET